MFVDLAEAVSTDTPGLVLYVLDEVVTHPLQPGLVGATAHLKHPSLLGKGQQLLLSTRVDLSLVELQIVLHGNHRCDMDVVASVATEDTLDLRIVVSPERVTMRPLAVDVFDLKEGVQQ